MLVNKYECTYCNVVFYVDSARFRDEPLSSCPLCEDNGDIVELGKIKIEEEK